MKTTLSLITIITSLFFSACANNNRAEYSNATPAANAYNPPNQGAQLQKDLMLDQFTKKLVPVSDGGIGVSSARFKKDIKPMDKTSETVLALKPVTFHYKSDTKGTPQFGLIAEEVAAVNPDLVVRDEKGEIYSVRYDAVNAMLLNEFLKEHRKVEALQASFAQQQKDFQATVAAQQKQIEALTGGLQKVSAQLEVSKPAPQVVNNNQ
jgi:Chaperone of endosialidase